MDLAAAGLRGAMVTGDGQVVSPFGIYIHWPFCASKCPYCDFNSHVRSGGVDEARFLEAYLRELAHFAALAPGRKVSSIFFGGGTPSLMAPATVGALLDAVAGYWDVAADAEITLEANPSSVEAHRFAGYRAAGVNRVSLGVQSLRDRELKSLGRLHTVAEAKAAIAVAQQHFERVSFDLIYARPNQTLAEWRAELTEALEWAAGHLSLYQLTIEPDTPYAALHRTGRLVVPEAHAAHDLYELTQELTEAAGLNAYEISNHAHAGQESRHNLLYWRYGDYAGLGAGAHGRLDVGGVRTAFVTERNPERWASLAESHGHGIIGRTPLTLEQQADEMLLMGLRIVEGLDLTRLAALCGLRPAQAAIERLARLGMVAHDRHSDRLAATPQGRMVLNEIVLRLSASLVPLEAAAIGSIRTG